MIKVNLPIMIIKKCEILNNFFASVFTKENDDELPNFMYKNTIANSLNTCNVTELEVEEALSSLNPNKSPGPDNLHPKFLKLTAKSLAKPIKLLFDKSLSEGEIPNDFKTAEVRPIFKKGNKIVQGIIDL